MPEKNDPNLGLSYGWEYGEDNWNTGHDASMRKIGALLHLTVSSATDASPPVSPANGMRYIVPASGASGDFSGQGGKVAVYAEGAWTFYTPATGWLAWVVDEQRHLRYEGSWKGTQPYDVGILFGGAPTEDQVLVRYPFPREVVFPSGLTGSKGVAGTVATAQTDFDIQKNGASVGTLRYAASATTATFIMASATTFAVGDVLTLVAPATPDDTLADLGIALVGVR